eukprot:TRINITY_DN879_c0_g1_i1.p1 TRINITY_DN879_c0_g1~~TRINITY_DN879_c0_g1_i1.p1  ORF type:complete len:475 (+),score=98.32 TRINITY_DN879_c0_g1_i1:210-1634(+)
MLEIDTSTPITFDGSPIISSHSEAFRLKTAEELRSSRSVRTYDVVLPEETKKIPACFIDSDTTVEIVPRTFNLKEVIQSKLDAHKLEDAFYVVDLGELVRKYRQWVTLLPNVVPFYAVKCNPKLVVLKTLADLGTNFDCASMHEIEAVLSIGVSPDRIIYANACKQPSHIRYARDVGVRMMTFDCESELVKIKANYPEAQLLLRLKTDDSSSVCQLSSKFGAVDTHGASLIKLAKKLELSVIGISFHVGSGCGDPTAYEKSLASARMVFDQALELGYDFEILDIGGGFPGSDGKVSFPGIVSKLAPFLTKYFPKTRLIAEPGRFFVATSHTLMTNIISKKEITVEATKELSKRLKTSESAAQDRFLYYVNDGVYGSFNNIMFDHASPIPYALEDKGLLSPATVFGPTCDGLDTICKGSLLPDLEVGDWLYWPEMGAYTVAAASMFNGFDLSRVFYVNSEADEAHFKPVDSCASA